MSSSSSNLIIVEHQPLPAGLIAPEPGMTCYLAEFIDTQMDDHFYVGFWAPRGLISDSGPIDLSRLVSWVAHGVMENEEGETLSDLVDQIGKATVVKVLGRTDLPKMTWPSEKKMDALSQWAVAERSAMAMGERLPGVDVPPKGGAGLDENNGSPPSFRSSSPRF